MDDPFGCVRRVVHRDATGTGALSDLTFVVKDTIDVAGVATGNGSRAWSARAQPAPRSAAVVERLLAAGAACVATVECDELAFALDGVHGRSADVPVNPCAAGRVPGGSSSGSAVAVAGGLAPLALGTDTAGSVRVPAACCGVVGFRPTWGVVSVEGVTALAPSFDAVGWLTRDGATAARVGDVLLPPSGRPPLTGLVLLDDAFGLAEPGTADALRAAARTAAARHGLAVRRLALPEAFDGSWLEAFRTIQSFEAHRAHGRWVAAHAGEVHPDVVERVMAGASVSPAMLDAARARRGEAQRVLAGAVGGAEALVLPTAPGPAPRRGDVVGAGAHRVRVAMLMLTCLAPLWGGPAVSLPVVGPDGLPIGLGLLAAPGCDRELLGLTGTITA